MPVLTCPFTAIPAQTIAQGLISYPEKSLVSTELAIKPTATETWSVEGLSLQFNIKYGAAYWVNVFSAQESLKKALAFLRASKVLLEQEKTELRAVEKKAEEFNTKEKTLTSEKELFEAKAAIYANVRSVEQVNREIEITEKEIKELGHTAAAEGIKTPPLVIIARMYARGNELVWNQQITTLRFFAGGSFFPEPGSTLYQGVWYEAVNIHTQFDDPLDFTERENLKLTLEYSAPPLPKEVESGKEGPEIDAIQVSQVQAVVNYSRQVAS